MADPAEILSERNAEVSKIRGFVELTDEAKERRIAEVNAKANTAYAEAREAEKRDREARLTNSWKAIFAVVDDVTASPAERAQIFSSYRSAAADVSLAWPRRQKSWRGS
jgi:hypothetical protein